MPARENAAARRLRNTKGGSVRYRPRGLGRPRGRAQSALADLVERKGGAAPKEAMVAGAEASLRRTANRARNAARQGGLEELIDKINRVEAGKEEKSGIFGFLEDTPGIGGFVEGAENFLQAAPVQSVLRTVDIPRAAIVAATSELTGSDDAESFMDKFNRRIGYGEVVEDIFGDDVPHWAKVGLGFVGDVALDPLSYTGAGVVTKGAEEATTRGAIAAGGAVGRKQLGAQVLEAAARQGLEGEAQAGARRLAGEAGSRGLGAFTERGLRRAGVDADLARVLGTPEFGLSVRAGRRRATIAGTRGLAEGVADVKGAVKARLGRPMSADQLAARVAANAASGSGQLLVDEGARRLAALGRRGGPLHRLGRLSEKDSVKLIHELESGSLRSPAAKALREWWDNIYARFGGDVDYRSNYVPHRLNVRGREWASDPDAVRAAGLADANFFTEAFEKPRVIDADTVMWGEKVGDPTIERINNLSRKHLGFDIMETDLAKLTQTTLKEAGRAQERVASLGAAEALGFARPLKETFDTSAVDEADAAVKAARQTEARATGKAASANSEVLKKAKQLAEELKRGESGNRTAVEEAIADSVKRTEELALKRERAAAQIPLAEKALEQAKRAAGIARRVDRRRMLKEVDRLTNEVEIRRAAFQDAAEKYQQSLVNTAAAENVADDALAQARADAQATAAIEGRRLRHSEQVLAEAEQAVPSGPVRAPGAEKDLADAIADVRRLDEEAKLVSLDRAQGVELLRELDARITVLNDILENAKVNPAIRHAAPADRAAFRVVSDKASIVSDALRTLDDPAVQQVAEIEAKAAAQSMDALLSGMKARKAEATLEGLRNPKVRDVVKRTVEKGQVQISPTHMADPDFARAYQKMVSIFEDPKQTNLALAAWDTFNNWFRTWAVTSPGFIIRNGMGGWMNNYSYGVRMADYRDFGRAFNLYKKAHATGQDFHVLARSANVEQGLIESVEAIAATGWGQSPQEAARSVFRGSNRGRVTARLSKSGKGMRPIPVIGSDAAITRAVRTGNEEVEALLRGSLAWSQVRSGATLNDAIETVSKIHFNYRDLSEFDRAAKRVFPFWVFMSRNIPLQLDLLARKPQYLNRVWGNLQRELGAGNEEEGVVPKYFEDIGAIPVGGGRSLVFDLPALRLNEDAQNLTNPLGWLSQAGPARVPIELGLGQNLFTGAPISGERQNAPVYGPLLEAVGLAEDGKVRGDVRHVVESIDPLLGRVSRLFPEERSGRKGAAAEADARQLNAIISTFLGTGLRTNSPNVQRGELLRRQRALSDLLKEIESRGG